MNIKKAIRNIFSSEKYIQMKFDEDGNSINGFTYTQKILGLPIAYMRKHLDLATGNGFTVEGSTFDLYNFNRRGYSQK